MILIKINHVDPYNILGFKRLSNKMKELSHIVKVNYYWDTYMTQLCLTNPCCLNLCFGFVCKSSKTKNPKILRINKNGELFPYSISNSKYLLGFFNGKSININKDFHIVIDNYIALQKNIYNRYVIKWPFLFFPIGGILEYESK